MSKVFSSIKILGQPERMVVAIGKTIIYEGNGCPESKQGSIPRPIGSTPAGVD